MAYIQCALTSVDSSMVSVISIQLCPSIPMSLDLLMCELCEYIMVGSMSLFYYMPAELNGLHNMI